MKRKAYLESSVWNRIVDRIDPERRRQTRSFLEIGRRRLQWCVSTMVTTELWRTPDLDLRRRLFRHLRKYGPRSVPVFARVGRIIEDLLARGVGGPNNAADLFHLGVAIDNRLDFLVSWDRNHLANERVNRLVRAYCRERGYNPIRIGTPIEVSEWARHKST